MKWIRYFVIVMFFITFNLLTINADCDRNEIKRLKEFADKIEVRYEYVGDDDNLSNLYNYKIIYNNVNNNGGIIIDNSDKKNSVISTSKVTNGETFEYIYNYGDDVVIKMYPEDDECPYTNLRTVKISLPIKNPYYDSVECNTIREKKINTSFCDEFIDKDLFPKSDDFYNSVKKYEDNDVETLDNAFNINKIFSFLMKPMVLVGIGLLILFVLIILIILKRKRDVLE